MCPLCDYFDYCMSLGEESSDTSTDGAYKSCVLESSGTKVCWYRHLQDVPRGRMLILSCTYNHRESTCKGNSLFIYTIDSIVKETIVSFTISYTIYGHT